MGGCVWNLERAGNSPPGRNGPPGTAVSTLRSAVRRSRIRMRFAVRPLRVAALEPAVSAGRERPAGDGGPHVAARRSPIADQNTLRRSPVAGRGAGARGLRGKRPHRRHGTARRERRAPDRNTEVAYE